MCEIKLTEALRYAAAVSTPWERLMDQAANRIEELEAELEIQKANASNARIDKECILQQKDELEATLERVRGLDRYDVDGGEAYPLSHGDWVRWDDAQAAIKGDGDGN